MPPTLVHAPAALGLRSGTRPAPRTVVFLRTDPQAAADGHDLRGKAAVTEGLAALMGCEYGGAYAADQAGAIESARPGRGGACYFVPSDTLTSRAVTDPLGIHGSADLFGGVVPFPYMATKVISHPLLTPASAAPSGWCAAFGAQVTAAVLPGYSVFTPADARAAGAQMLQRGAVRLKDPAGVGGLGQWVLHNGADLEAHLKDADPLRLSQHGWVLEQNLRDVVTYSVGQVQVADQTATYCGTQRLTRNHGGLQVYGGSDLLVARGGFDELLRMGLPPVMRTAVQQALVYHRAAHRCFVGFFASRCNYDVAVGTDDSGRPAGGVLEQSWRIGGASGAEVAALHAFARDPALPSVRAATCEVYGDPPALPAQAWVLFSGNDAHVGRLTKYAFVTPHAETDADEDADSDADGDTQADVDVHH